MCRSVRPRVYGKNCVKFSPPLFASVTLPPTPAMGTREVVPAPVVPVLVATHVGEGGHVSKQTAIAPEDTVAPAGDEPSGNVFMTLWSQYNELLEENPIMVKSMTSLFGFMIGDICAQSICGIVYDPMRTARLTLFGIVMDGPVGHWWYMLLDKHVMPDDPKSVKAIISKMVLDQLIWAPMFSCVFFTFVRTLEGHPEAALATIQSELVATIVANYAVWPLAHIINFRFVPSQQRILYINFVQILWTCYLSNLAANGHAHMFQH